MKSKANSAEVHSPRPEAVLIGGYLGKWEITIEISREGSRYHYAGDDWSTDFHRMAGSWLGASIVVHVERREGRVTWFPWRYYTELHYAIDNNTGEHVLMAIAPHQANYLVRMFSQRAEAERAGMEFYRANRDLVEMINRRDRKIFRPDSYFPFVCQCSQCTEQSHEAVMRTTGFLDRLLPEDVQEAPSPDRLT